MLGKKVFSGKSWRNKMSDYKYSIQMLAEEIAEDKYLKSFSELTKDEQEAVYTQAEKEYWESRAIK